MPANVPSDRTLVDIHARASRMITTLSTRPPLFRALMAGGYSLVHHNRGIDLAVAVIGYVPPESRRLTVDTPHEVQDAIAACDAIDDLLIARIDGALALDFAAQRDFILHNLSGSSGVSSVINLRLIAERLESLATGRDRAAAQRPQDTAALATLAERGIDASYRATLVELVAAGSGADIGEDVPTLSLDELRQRQIALYYWYREWANIARRLIARRDWLVSLGLATRKTNAAGHEEIVIEVDENPDPVPATDTP